MGRGIARFTDLRAWQACDTYKKAVYKICRDSPLARDWTRREQLETSVAGPPAHIAEGFGIFNPPQFANYAATARASLIESQNHLHDAVDKGYITEETRKTLDALAEVALQEVTGLMEYLRSPEALRNARRIRERRMARRADQPRPLKSEPGTQTSETPNAERRTEPRTRTGN